MPISNEAPPAWEDSQEITPDSEIPSWNDTTEYVEPPAPLRPQRVRSAINQTIQAVYRPLDILTNPAVVAGSQMGQERAKRAREAQMGVVAPGSFFPVPQPLAEPTPEDKAAGMNLVRSITSMPGRVLAAGARTVRDVLSPSTYLPEDMKAPPPFVINTRGEQPELRQMTRAEEAARDPLQGPRALIPVRGTQLEPEGSEGAQLLSGLSTPDNIGIIAAGGASKIAGMALLFSMAPGIYEDVKKIASSEVPLDQKRQSINNLLIPLVLGAKGAYERPIPEVPQVSGPPALGSMLQIPEGARPPVARAAELVGPPVPGRAKFLRPEVPGTAAEPYETALATIRKANARTRKQIQALFPERRLKNEEAADLRDAAWGAQPQPEPPAAPPKWEQTEPVTRTPEDRAAMEHAREIDAAAERQAGPTQEPLPPEPTGTTVPTPPQPPAPAGEGAVKSVPTPPADVDYTDLEQANKLSGQELVDLVRSRGTDITDASYELGAKLTPETRAKIRQYEETANAETMAVLEEAKKLAPRSLERLKASEGAFAMQQKKQFFNEAGRFYDAIQDVKNGKDVAQTAVDLGVKEIDLRRLAEAAPAEAAATLEPKPGMTRLYHGEGAAEGAGAGGGWFTENPEYAAQFGKVTFVDVPKEAADAARQAARNTGTGGPHFILPDEYVKQAQPMATQPGPKTFDVTPEEPAKPETPTAPAGPDPLDRVTLAMLPLKHWMKVTKTDQLPTGYEFTMMAKRLGVKRDRKTVIEALHNEKRLREILKPFEQPKAAAPAAPVSIPAPSTEVPKMDKPAAETSEVPANIKRKLPAGFDETTARMENGKIVVKEKPLYGGTWMIVDVRKATATPYFNPPKFGTPDYDALPMGAKGAISEYETNQKIIDSGMHPTGKKATKAQIYELSERQWQVIKNFERESAKPAEASTKVAGPEAKPDEPAATPAQAAAQVETQVSKTAEREGPRSAKAVKSDLVSEIEDEIANAPSEGDPEFNPEKVKTVTINIPGDGDFTIRRTKEALTKLLEKAKALKTSPGGGQPKPIPTSVGDLDAQAANVIKAYGSPEAAYQTAVRQRAALPDNNPETPKQAEAVDRLIARLYEETKAGKIEAELEKRQDLIRTYREGGQSFEAAIGKIEAKKKLTASNRIDLNQLRQRFTENRNRLKQYEKEAAELEQQLAKEKVALEAGTKGTDPSQLIGPGSAARLEFEGPEFEPPDPGAIGLSAGSLFFNRLKAKYQHFYQGISQLFKRSADKQILMQLANAADNLPRLAGHRAGQGIRERTSAPDRSALTFVMQALKMSGEGLSAESAERLGELEFAGDPGAYLRTKATDMETLAQQFLHEGKKLNAEAAIAAAKAMRFAIRNFARLRPLADTVRAQFDKQFEREGRAGISTDYENWHVPQRHDLDLMTSSDRPIVLGHSRAAGTATGFKKAKVYEDYATAIENGFVPRSLDIADLIEHRVNQGERLVQRKALFDRLRAMTDPVDGKSLAQPVPRRSIPRPDGTVDVQEHIPLGYQPFEVIPGYRMAIHEGYGRLMRALTGTSQLAESAAVGALQDIAGIEKHISLALDTFHASRTMQAELSLTGKLSVGARQRLGRALVEYNLGDLQAAVSNGSITQEMADYIKTPRPIEVGGRTIRLSPHALVQLGAREGLNLARFNDALYRDWIREFPVSGKVNKWVFDKLTRSAITHGFLAEFERVAKQNPQLNATEVARKVASDVNVFFGNLQKESIFRNPSVKSILQVLFLAPNWVEALVRREARAVKQVAEIPVQIAKGQPVHFGTAAKGIGSGLAAYFVGTQLLNLITRGHLTFSNEEKGHKLDAWIPDVTGKTKGYFISPLSVFGEVTHDILRYAREKPDLWAAVNQIGSNKMGNLGRLIEVMISGRDPANNEKLIGTGRRAITAATQLVPVPISLSQAGRAVGSKVLPGVIPPAAPGSVQRQIVASAGFKTEPAGTAQRQIYSLADEWKSKSSSAKLRAEVERRLKEDFGPSDYADLRGALLRDDLGAARRAFDELRKTKEAQVINRALRHPHPFTGSAASERSFIRSLSDHDKALYKEALEERKQLYSRYRQMLNRPE